MKGCGFGVFTGALENGGSVRGINAEGQGAMPRKKIDKLVEFAKSCGARGLAYLSINEDGTYKSSFAKFMTEEELSALVSKMNGKPGDLLLFAADKNKIVWNVLGALRLLLGLAGLVMMLVNKDHRRFTSEDWRDFAAVLIISALLAFYFLRDATFNLSSMLLPEAMFLAGLVLVTWAVKAGRKA